MKEHGKQMYVRLGKGTTEVDQCYYHTLQTTLPVRLIVPYQIKLNN